MTKGSTAFDSVNKATQWVDDSSIIWCCSATTDIPGTFQEQAVVASPRSLHPRIYTRCANVTDVQPGTRNLHGSRPDEGASDSDGGRFDSGLPDVTKVVTRLHTSAPNTMIMPGLGSAPIRMPTTSDVIGSISITTAQCNPANDQRRMNFILQRPPLVYLENS